MPRAVGAWLPELTRDGVVCSRTSHGAYGALDVQAPTPRAVQIEPKGLNVPAKTSWEIEISAKRLRCPSLLRIFILQRVVLPLSLPALFLLIYDKLDLVFLSRFSFLAASAHPPPRQRSPQHSNIDFRSACIPPRRH